MTILLIIFFIVLFLFMMSGCPHKEKEFNRISEKDGKEIHYYKCKKCKAIITFDIIK